MRSGGQGCPRSAAESFTSRFASLWLSGLGSAHRGCFRDFNSLAHQHPHFMGQAIITQQNHVIALKDSIELNSRDAATKRVWILDFDSIGRFAAPVVNLELA